MPLDAKKLQGLLFKKQDSSSLARILLEYATLLQKLEASSSQSWYFKQGLDANKKRILNLKKEFNDDIMVIRHKLLLRSYNATFESSIWRYY